ncbi:hypothetical protein ASPVEDRAFT_47487 [Aspergillus versicolor CBS 583.65]|uniref:AB hydrolase-1 domain-containing protein n=1 Tax=Aspergillus versicolor CBS 583.65 TaxID=1036611 RepID=A0A1L9Q3I3_ASPVE|nr:uncharacterized protein ASPVEDRAFT_47487 [Aspergillus versicolor CBS 583.65]OJJ08324.1 hypothetical protein ASPVEDRAFT_47487 [Aspergillus versicolor CBS 583.65]
MEPFKLSLSNGTVLAGIRTAPLQSTILNRPLVVGLHGGTYSSSYFDADSKHTAAIHSTAFGVPFVSIDRPCYGNTSPLSPIPEGSSFPQETGAWLHRYALPALWSQIGKPNGCNCIVLLSHSLGVMGCVIAAAMHGQDEQSSYPLGGIIVSGLGEHSLPEIRENPVSEPNVPPDRYVFPLEIKDAMMFRPGTVDPGILNQSKRLDHPTPVAEAASLRDVWLPTWREWAAHVTAPVMFAIVEQDCFFVGTEEHVRQCISAFTKSERTDGSLIKGAPHCMELSYWSQGWYARCFGFAMECSASLALRA